MRKALYRKYRSRKLSEIVGQDHVTSLLKRAIETDRVAHAYLFTGPRGVGKTSIARILAHEINQLDYNDESNHLDIIEIDAASNNGVDDIRDLREKVNLAPVQADKKIYIIDEVHMLSKPAFNALLKTLEEPPEHVVFILATTDVEKLPLTIISRTQRHNFSRASIPDIKQNLSRIAKAEDVSIDEAALDQIAQHSDGSFRDSVGILDQLIASKADNEPITRNDVEAGLGLAEDELIETLLSSVREKKLSELLSLLDETERRGIQAKTLAAQLIDAIRGRATTAPEFLSLLADLLDVATSSAPQFKLISVLGIAATPPQSRASHVAAPVREIVAAEIPELAQKAVEPHPQDTPPPSPKTKSSSPEDNKQLKKRAKKALPNTFDADAFKTFCKAETIALAAIITKCDVILSEHGLEIYAKSAFYKKKLESARFQQVFHDALAAQDCDSDVEIVVHAGAKPSNNSQVAAITAIMGGGEEVSAEDAT